MKEELEEELGVETPELETPEPETPEPETPKALTAADVAAAVASVVAPARTMSPEQVEQEWLRLEAESGMTRQQLEFNDRARREANLRDNLPLYEEVGEKRAKDALGADKDLMSKVKEMMARHPANVRANPQAWEDAAFLIKGKHGSSKPAPKKDGGDPGKVVGGGKVNPGLSEGGRGGAGSGKGGGSKKQYSELEQRIINTTCGGDAEAYEKYKDKGSTKPRAVEAAGENKADIALRGLTRGARV